MESMDELLLDVGNPGGTIEEDNGTEVEDIKGYVDELSIKVDKIEERMKEVEQFYSTVNKKSLTTSKGSSVVKDKDRNIISIRKQHQDASHKEVAGARRMQDLIRQFATILRVLTQLPASEPFREPVDVKGLMLDDYYEIIEKPMDLGTIKNKMEAVDGTGYKNVREIYADVRLVFKNAMKYNDERSDIYDMAKIMLSKFEEKWQKLLPKVVEEEDRLEDEIKQAQLDLQLAQEAAHAKTAREISNEMYEVNMYLEELREKVVQKCRKFTTEEKRKLGTALTRLSPEDLSKALEIVAQNNPGFQATAEEVDLDIDAQSESTLWRLKFFVMDALAASSHSPSTEGKTNNTAANPNKRKQEICEALAKTAFKRNKNSSK